MRTASHLVFLTSPLEWYNKSNHAAQPFNGTSLTKQIELCRIITNNEVKNDFSKNLYNCFQNTRVFEMRVTFAPNKARFLEGYNLLIIKFLWISAQETSWNHIKKRYVLYRITLQSASYHAVFWPKQHAVLRQIATPHSSNCRPRSEIWWSKVYFPALSFLFAHALKS